MLARHGRPGCRHPVFEVCSRPHPSGAPTTRSSPQRMMWITPRPPPSVLLKAGLGSARPTKTTQSSHPTNALQTPIRSDALQTPIRSDALQRGRRPQRSAQSRRSRRMRASRAHNAPQGRRRIKKNGRVPSRTRIREGTPYQPVRASDVPGRVSGWCPIDRRTHVRPILPAGRAPPSALPSLRQLPPGEPRAAFIADAVSVYRHNEC